MFVFRRPKTTDSLLLRAPTETQSGKNNQTPNLFTQTCIKQNYKDKNKKIFDVGTANLTDGGTLKWERICQLEMA